MQPHKKSEGSKKRVGLPVLLAALLATPLSGYLWLAGESGEAGAESEKRQPSALFDESIACSQPDAAQDRAREAEEAAMAKMQRYPFSAQDGIQAARLYAEAVRCRLTAGQNAEASRARGRLQMCRDRLNRDYQSLQLRLELALQNNRNDDALREIKALQALLAHRNDNYTRWLLSLERELEVNNPEEEWTDN